jgi:integrase
VTLRDHWGGLTVSSIFVAGALAGPASGVSARTREVPDDHHHLVHVHRGRVAEPVFSPQERLALAGFLAGYTGLTREAYALDLRQYASWCQLRHLRLFQARRADIECFARDLETRGRARATITRRLCTIAGFYRYAVEEELLEHSPAAHVRRPRLDYESHATRLDRNELGTILVAAGLGAAAEHALISLLALNGLRVSEATGASIEALGNERGHRTLTITRKGGKVVTIPLAPRTARAIDLTVGERSDGPPAGRPLRAGRAGPRNLFLLAGIARSRWTCSPPAAPTSRAFPAPWLRQLTH